MAEAETLVRERAAIIIGAERVRARRSHLERNSALHPTWESIARPEQRPPPGSWRIWMFIAGRGAGKTRAGAEWIHEQARTRSRLTIAGPTAADARDILIEGESGILATAPPDNRPDYEPSKRRLTWPNGARATILTADEPDRFRGHQHEAVWGDEIASWRYLQDSWDQLMFGLRLGADPRAMITTTPRPLKAIRTLMKDPNTVVTRGTTYDNIDNLAPAFFEQVISRYEGTRLGRQELQAEILDDVEGALWTQAMIDTTRVREAPDLARIMVAVDPSGGDDDGNDEQGIIVMGKGVDGDGYVLADRSCRLSPDGWGRRAVQAYLDFEADRIVAERNFGGDMVEHTISTAAKAMGVTVPVKVITASRGKRQRAEPIAALYEQEKVHHVGGFPELEDQLCAWTPESGKSPDRLDALVWAGSVLMLGKDRQSSWGFV